LKSPSGRSAEETGSMTNIPNLVGERLKAIPAGPHPDPDLLTAFAEQALSARERIPVLDHLARCGQCREVVALAIPPTQSPALVSGKDTTNVRKAPWFRWHTLRWGALAACLVIVASAMLMQRSIKMESPSPSGPMKASVDTVPLREVAPLPNHTMGVTDQEIESKQDKLSATKRVTSRDEKALPQEFVFSAKDNAELAKALNKETPVSSEERLQLSADAAPAAQPAPAPPTAPAAPPGIPQAESRSLPVEGRNVADVAASSLSRNMTQTVAIDATAPAGATGTSSGRKDEAVGKAKAAGAQFSTVGGLAAPAANEDAAAREKSTGKPRSEFFRNNSELSRWTISSDGQLQHSIDSGKTWRPVKVAEKATFRALSANGPDVWVGGAAGLLYHSIDAGGHWTQVQPTFNGVVLAADVAAIEFTDPQHGKITTSTGEAWITVEAGETWQKQP